MGAVCLAMSGHQDMETVCVVKRLLPALLSHPEHVRRFRHEADLARQLVHSNLAHTHNIGEVAGEVFLVQEFVEGHDVSALLDELAERRRQLPVPVAIHIASEIARGLTYAHDFEKLELVHRDINPPNIRLTYSGEVKLLDFGIASSNLHGDALGEHRGAGKLWHLAPEQVKPGGKIDRRTDIYALGVVLWELLTQRAVGTVRQQGRETRLPETEGEVLLWITRGEHQPPSLFNPEVPFELDALVAKATNVNPEYRYANAEELRRDLATFIPAGFHPEPLLSSLMKELFSPEADRAERRGLVEAARPMLAASDAHHHEHRRASDAVPEEPLAQVAESRPARRRSPWIASVVAGALACLGALVFLRPAVRPVEQALPAKTARPGAAVIASVPKSPSVASAPVAALRPKSPPIVAAPSPVPAPVPVVPETNAQQGDSDPKQQHPAAPKRPEIVVAPSLVRIDHLRLARDAFNARDWAAALGEGKSAVAAGGGAEAHSLLGNTYFKMGHFAEAEQAYAKAVALDPANVLLQDRLRIAHVRAQEDGRNGMPGKEN